MVDIEFIGQLVDSMDDAVVQLEQALEKDDKDRANDLRTFIFDLHRQIAGAIGASRENRNQRIDNRGAGEVGNVR